MLEKAVYSSRETGNTRARQEIRLAHKLNALKFMLLQRILSSQHPHGNSQLPVTPVWGSDLHGLLYACGTYTYTHSGIYTKTFV